MLAFLGGVFAMSHRFCGRAARVALLTVSAGALIAGAAHGQGPYNPDGRGYAAPQRRL